MWHLLALGVVFGAVSAFFDPAYRAVVPELVPLPDRPSANSLHSLSRQLASVVGPGLGAILVAAGGTALAFALDGVSYFVAATFVLVAALVRERSRVPAPEAPSATPASATPESGAVRRGVATRRPARGARDGARLALDLDLDCRRRLQQRDPGRPAGGGVETLGLLASLGALGAVGSAIVLGRTARIRHRGLVVCGAWLVLCAATVLYGLPVGLAGAAVAALVAGAANTGLNLAWTSSLQDLVPGDRLGRVTSIDAVGSAALIPVGYAVAGLAADAYGAATVFVAGGLVSAVVIVAGLLHPAIRGLD